MNRKALIAIVFLYIILVVTFFFSEGQMAAILLFLLTVTLVVLFLVTRITGRRPAVKITGGEQASRGETCVSKVILENKGRLPLFDGTVVVLRRNLLTGIETESYHRISVPAGKQNEIEIRDTADHVGCIETSCRQILIGEPLGIFRKKRDAEAAAFQYVIPTVNDHLLSESDVSAYDMESYKYSEYTSGGDPSETFDIREYRGGDNIKGIHWKLSAKLGETMIREASLPIENTVLVLLDKCCSKTPEEIDRTMDLFASISGRLLKMDIAHSLGWYDREQREMIFRRVIDETDFWNAVVASLEGSFGDGPGTTPELLALSSEEKIWASYVYVSDNEAGIDTLREYGEVIVERPSEYK